MQRGKFYRLTPWERETTMVVDYCSAACFLTTREIFDRISGFDPIFEPAYYEDVDLCFKIACLGTLCLLLSPSGDRARRECDRCR